MGDRGRVPASPDCGIRRKRWMVGEILRRVEGRREFADALRMQWARRRLPGVRSARGRVELHLIVQLAQKLGICKTAVVLAIREFARKNRKNKVKEDQWK